MQFVIYFYLSLSRPYIYTYIDDKDDIYIYIFIFMIYMCIIKYAVIIAHDVPLRPGRCWEYFCRTLLYLYSAVSATTRHYETIPWASLENKNNFKMLKRLTLCNDVGLYCTIHSKLLICKNIRPTQYQNWNVSRLILQFSLPNPLKPSVKSKMNMQMEQRPQPMPKLHLSDQEFYCLLRCDLY